MKIFDYFRPMKVYTAAEVHAEITAKVVLLMEEMKKQVEAVSLPVEMQSELELLRATGLTDEDIESFRMGESVSSCCLDCNTIFYLEKEEQNEP